MVMGRLRKHYQRSPYYKVSPSDKESLKNEKKEVVFEINDGSNTKPAMTKDELNVMTVAEMRKLARSDEIELTATLRDKNADDESDDDWL